MIPDVEAAVVAYLKTDAEVSALCGGRIFGAALPDVEAANMPRKAVVVQLSGGVNRWTNSYLPLSDRRVDVLCYGETMYEAARMWRAVAGALKRVQRTVAGGALLHSAGDAGGLLRGRDADTGWPVVWSSWQITLSDVEVT